MEIGSYELLKRVAQRAGDPGTAAACDRMIAEEQAMADAIASSCDRFAELSLREGVARA
jgi:ferritin-like metal-binding protein YciE